MKTILEEYGKLLIVVIVGMIVLGSVVTGICIWYQMSFPDIESYDGIVVSNTAKEPVMIVEDIEIEKMDEITVVDYASYVTAYEDSNQAVVIPVEIMGEENVDVTSKGIYQIICSATNSTGHSYSRRVPVLIY